MNYTYLYIMKKLLFILSILPLLFSCEKEEIPIPQGEILTHYNSPPAKTKMSARITNYVSDAYLCVYWEQLEDGKATGVRDTIYVGWDSFSTDSLVHPEWNQYSIVARSISLPLEPNEVNLKIGCIDATRLYQVNCRIE